jgi:ubiquinone biosynthesis protein
MNEFDFQRELTNIQRFSDMYAYSTKVIVPKVFTELCTESVLVMSFVPSDGPPVNSRELVSIFIQQMLFESYVHGDLHSGNIGLKGSSIILYDFGNVIRTTSAYRKHMMDFIYYVQVRDTKSVIETMKKMGMVVVSEATTFSFIQKFFEYIETADISAFTFDPDEIQDKIPIELDATTVSLLRSYSLLEGYCKRADPLFSYENILSDTIETLYLDTGYMIERAKRDIKKITG